VVTVASLLAFILFAPIAEYDGIKLPVFKYVAIIGALSCVLFLGVVTPELIWIGALLFLISKVASRVAGLMYDAMLHDVSRGIMKAADEIANRAAALGYIGMILFFIIYVGLFFVGSQLGPDDVCGEDNANQTLPDGRLCLPEGAKASSGSSPSVLPLRPTNASVLVPGQVYQDDDRPEDESIDEFDMWIEHRIPTALVGAWWIVVLLVGVLPYLKPYPGVPRPASVKEGTVWSYVRFSFTTGLLDQWQAFVTASKLPDLWMFLLAWMLLSDASSTATSSAALILADELGFSTITIGFLAAAGLGAAAVGIAFYRWLIAAEYLTGFQVLNINLGFLAACGIAVIWASNEMHVFAIAIVGGLQIGTIGSLTKSMLCVMLPRDQQTRLFSVYELTQKGTSWIAPLFIAIAN